MYLQKTYTIYQIHISIVAMSSQISLLPLPPQTNLETIPVLRALTAARANLGELKGTVKTLPNPKILIDSLFLQEALASSEIENIVTTHDEAFQGSLFDNVGSVEAKEVKRYRSAMWRGYEMWQENRIISENLLIEMFRLLKQHDGSYRTAPGIVIRNMQTGETIYTPPQDPQEIVSHMRALEQFMNDQTLCDLDPLIKMALIHHQFESIHPFSDGNGRIGRILCVLYLTHVGLLDVPILYLSRAINRTKSDYYRLLQTTREHGDWEDWNLYMLNSVSESARSTLRLVSEIHHLMLKTKHRMRIELPNIYSQDLLNNLFRHPYTRIESLEKELPYGYQTARKYLKLLTDFKFVEEVKQGRNNYYINRKLVDVFVNVSKEG